MRLSKRVGKRAYARMALARIESLNSADLYVSPNCGRVRWTIGAGHAHCPATLYIYIHTARRAAPFCRSLSICTSHLLSLPLSALAPRCVTDTHSHARTARLQIASERVKLDSSRVYSVPEIGMAALIYARWEKKSRDVYKVYVLALDPNYPLSCCRIFKLPIGGYIRGFERTFTSYFRRSFSIQFSV